MANEPTVTIIGNLTADPELRYTTNGSAVANVTIASTPRTYNKQQGEYVDGETLFMRCGLWGDIAEHAAQSLTRGQQVIVQGRLISRSFETKQGERRTVTEVQADNIGVSLRFGTTVFTKSQPGQRAQNPPQQGGGWGPRPDPVAPSEPINQETPWGNTQPTLTGEPPF